MRSFWLVVIATVAGFVANSAPLDFWTNRITGTNLILRSADFGNGVFVVVTSVPGRPSEGAVFVSSDGCQWVKVLDDSAGKIIFGNGIFVGEGGLGILVSGDGYKWITRLSKGANLQFGLGQFWVERDIDTPPAQLRYSSADGLTWTLRTTNAPRELNSLFCHDRFLGREGDQVLQSFDGVTFSPAPGWPLALTSVAHLNGTWVCAGEVLEGESRIVAPTICVSTNGIDWSRMLVDGQNGSRQVASVAGGRFILTVDKNYFYESLDGFNWTDHRIVGGTGNSVTRIVYGADSMVALCNHQEGPRQQNLWVSGGSGSFPRL